MRVEIWSDVVCPWCYIGKRRFDRAVRQLEGVVDVEVVWKPFLLDPHAGAQPVPLREVYARKFGGPDAADDLLSRLTAIARAEDLVFDFDAGQVRVTTMPAHRLLWLGGREGDQNAVAEALFSAHFTAGRSVADVETLVDAGAAGGIPEARVVQLLEGTEGDLEVREELARAEDLLITGVPTYVVGGRWPIPGAQETSTFERVLRRLAEVEHESEPGGA